MEAGGFSELLKDLATAVVAEEKLNASEEVVFEAVVAWGEANKGSGSIRDEVVGFLPHLRFCEMGHAFIHKRVRQSGVVPESMVSDALLQILDEKSEPGCKRAFDDDCESGAAVRPAKKCRRGCVLSNCESIS